MAQQPIDLSAPNLLSEMAADAEANFTELYAAVALRAPAASPTFTGRVRLTPAALASGATVSTDASLSNVFTLTLGANATLANPANLVQGVYYTWFFKQDATGGRTLSFGPLFKFPGGSAPVLSTAANALDILSGYSDGTNVYCGGLVKDIR